MKGKLIFGVLCVFGFLLAGCATTDPNAPPPYQFDGTAWTKTEEYELVCKGSNWEVLCGSNQIAAGNDTGEWKLDGTTLIFGDDGWWNGWGHAAGTWTLKSGTPATNSLDGTTWTRTAVLEVSFSNGKMYAKDGTHVTTDNKNGDPYRVTSTEIRVTYSQGTAKWKYIVDGDTLTVTSPNTFSATRLEGGPWTKK
jgi:hypothetical protein